MASIEKRVSKSGDTSYRVKIRLKGHTTQTATFNHLTDARKWEQQTEAAIREGRHFKTSEAKRHTVSDLIDRYLDEVKHRNHKRYQDVKPKLEWWKGKIGQCTLSNLTKSMIIESRDNLLKNPKSNGESRSPSTVNRFTTVLSHAFTVAVNEWEWLENHPMKKISKLKEPRGRVRFLSDDERERLLKACREVNSPYLYLIVILALSTGARRGEILNLCWKDIDMNRGVITLHETKNGERRVLPLTGYAMELMKKHQKVRHIGVDYVFPSKRKFQPANIRSAWDSVVKQAEIEDFRFHDLRHSAASYLAMNGASLAEIAEVLGHKTLQMVKRYAHLSEAHTASVVAKMNEKNFG